MLPLAHYTTHAEALAAVSKRGLALEFASEALKANREVVLAAVKGNGIALQNAPGELRADRDIVLAAVKQNGLALGFASAKLRADREVVLAAVAKNGLALQFASKELRADREVALAAVQENGSSLRYASRALRADREAVVEAVKQYGHAITFASVGLQADREVRFASSASLSSLCNFGAQLQTVAKDALELVAELHEESDLDKLEAHLGAAAAMLARFPAAHPITEELKDAVEEACARAYAPSGALGKRARSAYEAAAAAGFRD